MFRAMEVVTVPYRLRLPMAPLPIPTHGIVVFRAAA